MLPSRNAAPRSEPSVPEGTRSGVGAAPSIMTLSRIQTAEGQEYDYGPEFRKYAALLEDGTLVVLERYADSLFVRSTLARAEARGFKQRNRRLVTPEELEAAYRSYEEGRPT